MNDITALMGKLKANVAYLQFDEPMTEQRVYWPVLDRAVQAQTTEVVVAEAVEALASVEVAPIRTIGPSLLRRYGKSAAEVQSRALSDIFARLERKAH
jgi:hypothetical protein